MVNKNYRQQKLYAMPFGILRIAKTLWLIKKREQIEGMFSKGDILLPANRVARRDWLNGLFHPAVVWNDFYDGNSDFQGIMLTHRVPNGQFDNILMAANHFENGYEVAFSNTHFVNQLFIKFQGWGAFELVGRLTAEGIEFIENNLSPNSFPIEFIQYRQLVTR